MMKYFRTFHAAFLAAVAMLIVAWSASGQDTAKKGPLAELPSKPGPHLDKIKALGDNQWVNLGAPAADPKWGKARGSSWGAKALIPCSGPARCLPLRRRRSRLCQARWPQHGRLMVLRH